MIAKGFAPEPGAKPFMIMKVAGARVGCGAEGSGG
jgi:hypothetical protein